MLEGKRETPFERFWSPVIKNPKHGLVYVGSNAVYALSPVFLDKYEISPAVAQLLDELAARGITIHNSSVDYW